MSPIRRIMCLTHKDDQFSSVLNIGLMWTAVTDNRQPLR